MKRILLGTALGAVLGCSGPSTRPAAPLLPELQRTEDAVAEKIQTLHDAVTKDPSAENWSQYAKTLHAHDMRAEARHAYGVVVQETTLPPSRLFEHLYLAGCLETRADPGKARELLEQALALRLDYEPLHLRLGELYEKERRFKDARHRYTSARRLRSSSHAWLGLGRVALEEGRIELAIGHLEKATRLDPNHREAFAALAPAYARDGRMEDAVAAASAAGNLVLGFSFPDPILASMAEEGVSFRSRIELAIATLNHGTADAALRHIEEALQLRSDAMDALFQKGRILAALERYEEASVTFDRVLEAQPRNIDALVLKSACLAKLGRSEAAQPFLARALDIDPYHVNSHLSLGTLLRKSDPDTAKEHLAVVLEQMPHRVEARVTLASILVAEGRVSEAETELRRVLERDPQNAVARSFLASLTRQSSSSPQ